MLLEAIAALFDLGQVRQAQLQVDHFGIAGRVNAAGHVDDVVILEAAHHMDDRVHLADVGQKLVAQALPLAGTLD